MLQHRDIFPPLITIFILLQPSSEHSPVFTSRAPGTVYLGAVRVGGGCGVGAGIGVGTGAGTGVGTGAIGAAAAAGLASVFCAVDAVAAVAVLGVPINCCTPGRPATGFAGVALRDRCLWAGQYLKYPPLNLLDVVDVHPSAAHSGGCCVTPAVGGLFTCSAFHPRRSQ